MELSKKTTSKLIDEYVKPAIIALALTIIIRSCLYEPFKIPSGSMKSNLIEGDYILVSKYSYGYGKHFLPISINIKNRIFRTQPERGDIIVFKSGEKDDDKNYIKRLIGMPGDEIYLSQGTVFINDVPLPKTKVGEYKGCDDNDKDIVCTKYLEELPNGIKYIVLDANHNFHLDFPDDTSRYIVPEKHYFFLGDNRNYSKDSRYLKDSSYSKGMGFIPEEDLVGRAEIIFWNSNISISDISNNNMLIKRLFRKFNTE